MPPEVPLSKLSGWPTEPTSLLGDTQDTAKRQLRSYVLYDNGTIFLSPDGSSYKISISIKNTGQTPAYSLRYNWNSTIREFPLKNPSSLVPVSPALAVSATLESADIGTGVAVPMGDDRIFAISADDLRAIRERTKAIYAVASITYHDTFQRDQAAQFIAVNLREEVPGCQRRRNSRPMGRRDSRPCQARWLGRPRAKRALMAP